MSWPNLNLNPSRRILRQFAATWLVFFGGIGLYQILAHGRHTTGYLLGALALFGIVGIFRPVAVRWLYIGLTVLVYPIGWVVNLVLLALMFYAVLTPVAFLLRLRGRDMLRLRDGSEYTSLWTERKGTPEPSRYLRQF